MDNQGMQKYASLMKEIKLRVNAIDHIISGRGNALYLQTTTECLYLQLRKILELIAFGSLIANRELYCKVYANFSKAWNAKRLLAELERVNPNFYPRSIREIENSPGTADHFVDRLDALTRDEFVTLYDMCGAIAHAENPFGSRIDYRAYRDSVLHWLEKVMHLLNCHTVRLVDDSVFYLVHMKEIGDEEVHWYRFELAGPQ